jgi:AraC-like DNA-binding protein
LASQQIIASTVDSQFAVCQSFRALTAICWKLEQNVNTAHIQVMSQGRRVPMFRDPVLSSANHRWAGFLVEESHSKMEPVPLGYLPNTTLFFCTGRSGIAHWKDRGVYHHRHITPGTVSIGRSHCELKSSWATSTWSRIVVQLDGTKLRSIAPYDIDAIQASFPPVLTTRDNRLAKLIVAMRDEVKEGCPSGRLFAESMSMALLAYLAGKYATPGNTHHTSSLSPAQKRCIFDYIRANLADDMSVTELAAIVHMSPAHFSRLFRVSLGIAPYRFVMQQRVEEAKRMLASSNLSASQVAMAFGFSSQSHFVKVFRQFTGVTPKQYRAGF